MPPPMSTHSLSLKLPSTTLPGILKRSAVPVHAAFASATDLLAVLWEPGILEIFDLKTRLGPGRGKVMNPVSVWSGTVNEDARGSYRQVVFDQTILEDNAMRLGILGSKPSNGDLTDAVLIVDILGGERKSTEVALPAHNGRLVPAQGLFWESPEGHLYEGKRIYAAVRIPLMFTTVLVNGENSDPLEVASFPEFCFWPAHAMATDDASGSDEGTTTTPLYIALSHASRLHVTDGQETRTLAANVNSFTTTPGFLIYTTTAHLAHFVPLKTLAGVLKTPEAQMPEWETRRVERGSKIVTAVPSTMSLVLQMPRGNLETINPRPLVMEIVRQDIDRLGLLGLYA